ncbi:MAG: hypothetical protein IKN98_01050 [Bacteroidales bacterium]|nr:hypothetical protein [Bacteroidales bacterium]
MKGYIYKYTFSDGKVYIGQTRRPPCMRDKEHFDEEIGKTNPKFWEAYQTFGMPQYEIIETIEEERVQDLVASLNEAETKHIQQFKATNPKYGYNIRERGTVPIPRDKVLDAEFERIWISCAEDWYPIFVSVKTKCFETFEPLTEEELEFCQFELADDENMFSNALKDFKFDFHDLANNSEEARFWLGECTEFAEWRFCEYTWGLIREHIERNKEQILCEHSPETTIVQIDSKGKVVREYASPEELREALQRNNLTNIYNVLEGKQRHAYGYTWRYKKDMENKPQDENGQLNIDFGE